MATPSAQTPVASSSAIPKMTNPFAGLVTSGQSSSIPKMANPFTASNMSPPEPTQSSGAGAALNHSLAVQMQNNSPVSSAPQTQPQNSGNWFTNGVKSVWNHSIGPVYHDLKGGLEGIQNSVAETQGPFSMTTGLFGGLRHPGQTEQEYQQRVQPLVNSIHNPLGRMGADFALSAEHDPASYIPGSLLGKAAEATGILPALRFGTDLAKGTVKTGKVASEAAPAATDAGKVLSKTVKPPLRTTPEQAKAINDAAGLTGGYKPATATRTLAKPVAPIAKPGAFSTKNATISKGLEELAGKHPNMDANTLKGMAPPKPPIKLPFTKVHQMRTAGVYPQDLAPHVPFKTVMQQFERPVANEPNFTLRGGQLMTIPQKGEEGAAVAKDATLKDPFKPPYAKYAWQSKVGAPIAKAAAEYFPKGLPGAKQAVKGVEHVFTALPGARQYFKNSISKFYGNKASLSNKYAQSITDAFKGTTPEEQTAIIHALESTAPGTKLADPRLEGMRQKVEPILSQLSDLAKSKGVVDHLINPGEMGVGRYTPHVVAGKLDTEGAPIYYKASHGLKPTMDASKERGLTGTIAQINADAAANPDKYKELYDHYGMKPGSKLFEDNGVKILAHHAMQLAHAASVKDLIGEVMAHGQEVPHDFLIPKGFVHPENGEKVGLYTHDGKTVLLPKVEADYMNGLGKQPGKFSEGYRKLVNLANQAMFIHNPLIHIGTNLGTQTLLHAPGAIPKIIKNIPEAFRGVTPGSPMDKAVQAGAMHLASEIGSHGTTAERADSIYHAVNPTAWDKAKKAASYYTRLTPIVEKAYRGGLFQHATNTLGQSPDSAAQTVRSIYGGRIAPDVVAPAEKVLQGGMPFINWTKTAIKSNVGRALQNPLPYSAIAHGLNAVNEANTGHGQLQNANPLYTALPETNAQGFQKLVEPYFPPFDAAKLAVPIAKEGPLRGSLDFAFKRTNPVIKFPVQWATNQQDPLAPPQNQFQVDPYAGNPLVPGWAHRQALAKQFLQDFSLQGVGTPNTNPTLLDRALQATGAYINAPNPASAAKEANWQQKNNLSGYKKWLKKQSQAK